MIPTKKDENQKPEIDPWPEVTRRLAKLEHLFEERSEALACLLKIILNRLNLLGGDLDKLELGHALIQKYTWEDLAAKMEGNLNLNTLSPTQRCLLAANWIMSTTSLEPAEILKQVRGK